MKVLPIFLNDLQERRCVVFGGSHEAEHKTEQLLGCEAPVTVISPTLTEKLTRYAEDGRITWHAREYQEGDLKEAFLAIVTEINPQKTAPIWREAQREKVLLNALDDVQHCSFVAGSVVRRGPLVISISTSGCAPALSVRIRQHLEKLYGEVFETFTSLLGSLRGPMQQHYTDFNERRERWYALVDSEILPLLDSGRKNEALELLEQIVGKEVARDARNHPDLLPTT